MTSTRRFNEIMSVLIGHSNETGFVTSAQIDDAFGADDIDIDLLSQALDDLRIAWRDPEPGPPLFPRGYKGPKLLKGGLD